ncbi:unnamed protein product [Prorocentrum cordatum]|uniref:Uncharacterized protein n=1 Tax=Prorocentrum cordatum TaxID=2364126 RepID=A0ABN9TEU6_9DINO|nr:unnamed protein product [Polarella glacialis]CAK0901745.1 unnamed protein product [Polarella glacialis]
MDDAQEHCASHHAAPHTATLQVDVHAPARQQLATDRCTKPRSRPQPCALRQGAFWRLPTTKRKTGEGGGEETEEQGKPHGRRRGYALKTSYTWSTQASRQAAQQTAALRDEVMSRIVIAVSASLRMRWNQRCAGTWY